MVEIRACVALFVEFACTNIPGVRGSIEAGEFVFVSRFLIGNGCLIAIQALILLAQQGIHTAGLVEGIFSVQAGLQGPLVDLLKIILPCSQLRRRNIECHAIFGDADGIDVRLEPPGEHEEFCGTGRDVGELSNGGAIDFFDARISAGRRQHGIRGYPVKISALICSRAPFVGTPVACSVVRTRLIVTHRAPAGLFRILVLLGCEV